MNPHRIGGRSRNRLFGRGLVASALITSRNRDLDGGVGVHRGATVTRRSTCAVLDDGSSRVAAIKAQMDFEGVPYTAATQSALSVITAGFLSSGNEALFQAVVLSRLGARRSWTPAS